MAEGYQLFTWNSRDYKKFLEIEDQSVKKFKGSSVYKRYIAFDFPSFSIKLNQEKENSEKIMGDRLLSELILYNLKMEMTQYLDYRKDLKLISKTFYILFKEQQEMS